MNRFTNFNCYGKIFFTWRHGSAGRAFASHARGHRFESCCLHQYSNTLQKCRVFLLPVSATGSNSDGFTVPVQNCTAVTKVTLHAIDLR